MQFLCTSAHLLPFWPGCLLRVNLWKACIIFMLICSWFQKGPYVVCNFIKKETLVQGTEHLVSLVLFLIYSGFRSSHLQIFFKIVQYSQENTCVDLET